ncbi:hypothetical protein XACS582_13090007 [Xanthomonas citri pv. citri]|nr:hypothetical protein XACS584_1820006 [Xanthomonas citri pv. citri]CEH58113.1 hypothetical protein XACS582_13090007 [Xanthomonas citri pv. citri]CEH99349.1 hypothetical protein XACS581_2430007 [Xanthomonas citri pv. citri]
MLALGQAAQDAANDALRAAQAGWEAERQEADALSQQMADAYEAQAGDVSRKPRKFCHPRSSAATSASRGCKPEPPKFPSPQLQSCHERIHVDHSALPGCWFCLGIPLSNH